MDDKLNNIAYLKNALLRFGELNKDYSQSRYQSFMAGFIVILEARAELLTNSEILNDRNVSRRIDHFLSQNNELEQHISFIRPVLYESSQSLEKLIWSLRGLSISNKELLELFDWVLETADVSILAATTPDEVAALMVRLLKVSPESSVLDPAMGSGGFLRAAKQLVSPTVYCEGVEVNMQVGLVKALYSYLDNIPIDESILSDAFSVLPEVKRKFDVVISNPPISRIPIQEAHWKYEYSLGGRYPSGEMSLNYIQLGLGKLKLGGSAAFLVNMSVLFSQGDAKRVRQEWLERGIVRAVIVLPSKLLPHTTNKCAILLFKNNKPQETIVKFVKADDMFERDSPRLNILSYLAETEITKRLNNMERTIDSAWIEYDEVRLAGYSLHPDSYVKKEIDEIAYNVAKQWTKLSDLAEIIQGTRGLKKLPQGATPVIRGVNIADMRKGSSTYVKVDLVDFHGKPKFTQPNDLLIKRLGDRSCVYMVRQGEPERLVDETVFILRFKQLNTAAILFIGEFLNSNRGSNHISSFCRSTTVQTLTKAILSEIDVPVADSQLQDLLGEMVIAESSLKSEYQKAKELRQQIFDGLGYEKAEGDFDTVRFALKTLETALSQKDKVSYKVSSTYPYPLAYNYRNVYMEREWSAVYDQQMKFGEMILSFLVGVGLSLLRFHLKEKPNLVNKIKDNLQQALKGGVSPGHWQALLHDICCQLREIRECQMAAEFSSVWFKGRGSKLSDFAHATTKEIVQKLNDKKHHRGPVGAEASKEASQAHKNVIDDILLSIEFISQWEFFINDDIRYQSESNTFLCSVRRLKGDHPCFEKSEIILNRPLSNGEIYFKYHSEVIPMSPFICTSFNQQTNRIEIYSLDKKDKGGDYLIKSFDSSHTRFLDESQKDQLNDWLLESMTSA